jgi:iron(III) transport system permease protein
MLALIVLPPLVALIVPNLLPATAPGTPPVRLLDWRTAILLGRTLWLASATTLITMLLGLALGYALAAQQRHLQPWLAGLVAVPLAIPPFINALCWIMLLEWAGAPCHGFVPACVVLSLSYTPMTALLVWAGLLRQDGAARDAARLGMGAWRNFFKIELPLLGPNLWTAVMLVGLLTASEYAVPSLFRVNTYPVAVFARFAAYYDLRGALAIAWPYVLLPALALFLWQRYVSPDLNRLQAPQQSRPPHRNHPAGCILLALGILLTGILPVAILAIRAGGIQTYCTAWRTAHPQLLTTLLLAGSSATLLVLLGFLISIGTRKASRHLQRGTEFLSLLPIALPGSLFGVGLIALWNHAHTPFPNAAIAILPLLYIARYIPFAICPQRIALSQRGRNMLDAAELSPASTWRRFSKVTLPIILPASATAWVICFALCSRELTGTLLVAPPGIETLAVRIYSLYHYGAGRIVAALSLFMLTANFVIIATVVALTRIQRPCSNSRT